MRIDIKPLSLERFSLLAGAVVLADQVSKLAVVGFLAGHAPQVLIPRLLQLTHRTNTGAAFSIFRDHPMVLTIFASAVALSLAVWGMMLKAEEAPLRWPLGLILGGAIGNLVDRYRVGQVTDFIDAHWNNVYHFPTFNVADSAICVGMGILIWMTLKSAPHPKAEGASSPTD